jgi:hypothetical protein
MVKSIPSWLRCVVNDCWHTSPQIVKSSNRSGFRPPLVISLVSLISILRETWNGYLFSINKTIFNFGILDILKHCIMYSTVLSDIFDRSEGRKQRWRCCWLVGGGREWKNSWGQRGLEFKFLWAPPLHVAVFNCIHCHSSLLCRWDELYEKTRGYHIPNK